MLDYLVPAFRGIEVAAPAGGSRAVEAVDEEEAGESGEEAADAFVAGGELRGTGIVSRIESGRRED